MSEITTIGLDLAKHVFQVHGIDAQGMTVLRKRLRRGQVLAFFSRIPRCVVGLEACATAHYWARELRALGCTSWSTACGSRSAALPVRRRRARGFRSSRVIACSIRRTRAAWSSSTTACGCSRPRPVDAPREFERQRRLQPSFGDWELTASIRNRQISGGTPPTPAANSSQRPPLRPRASRHSRGSGCDPRDAQRRASKATAHQPARLPSS